MSLATKICIDPGHSRNTAGKRAGSNPTYYEYLSNRNVAKRLRKMLEASGFDCIYSCDLDDVADKSLAARANTAVMMHCDMYISIHSNAGAESARGTETFVHNDSTSSIAPANLIQSYLVKELGTKNRGLKKANFGVLRGTYKSMYSLLTEGEFYTNTEARKWMLTADYEIRYARGVAKGVCAFYEVPFRTGEEINIPAPVTDVKPVVTTPDVGASIVRVKVAETWVYSSPNWDSKQFKVKEAEAFTVMEKVKVGNEYMYKLKSGLYITADENEVELDGKVALVVSPSPTTPSEPAPIRPYPNKLFRLTSPYMKDGTGESDIEAIQRAVDVKPDGVYGPNTEKAVRAYQKNQGLTADGIVGRDTWNRMF